MLDAADHAEPAPRDLVRAEVEAHGVRLPRSVDKHRAAVVTCDEVVRDAGARRTRDGVAGPKRVLLGRRPALRARGRRREMQRRGALEDDEDLLLLGVAVRDRSDLPRRDLLPGEACELRVLPVREPGPRLVAVALELDVGDVADVLGPRLRLADLERRHARLDVPRVVVAALDPRPADPDRARAWEPADLRRVAPAEDEVLEPVGSRNERVLVVVGAVDDAVARPDLMDVAVLPREAGAGEHEEELLRRAVRVRRRRQHPRRDAHAV